MGSRMPQQRDAEGKPRRKRKVICFLLRPSDNSPSRRHCTLADLLCELSVIIARGPGFVNARRKVFPTFFSARCRSGRTGRGRRAARTAPSVEAVKIAGHMQFLPLFGIIARQFEGGCDRTRRTFFGSVLRASDLRGGDGGSSVLLLFSVFHFLLSFIRRDPGMPADRTAFLLILPRNCENMPYVILWEHFALRHLIFESGI